MGNSRLYSSLYCSSSSYIVVVHVVTKTATGRLNFKSAEGPRQSGQSVEGLYIMNVVPFCSRMLKTHFHSLFSQTEVVKLVPSKTSL